MALPRKLRRRTPRRWAECPDDLHDYAGPTPQRQASPRAEDGPMRVTDDWPEHVPIGDAELRVCARSWTSCLAPSRESRSETP